jgi:hypothetical protein
MHHSWLSLVQMSHLFMPNGDHFGAGYDLAQDPLADMQQSKQTLLISRGSVSALTQLFMKTTGRVLLETSSVS